jgi:hypothetical protein
MGLPPRPAAIRLVLTDSSYNLCSGFYDGVREPGGPMAAVARILRKDETMYKDGKRAGTIRFLIKPRGGASTVELAGDFNDWQPKRMRKLKTGEYYKDVKLLPGTHEYKFLVDGEWVADPDHDHRTVNEFHTHNSVAEVPVT